jgi:hypothetical protein
MDDQHADDKQKPGFNQYMAKRLIIAALLIILVVWAFSSAPKSTAPEEDQTAGNANTTVAQPSTILSQPTGPLVSEPASEDSAFPSQPSPNGLPQDDTADSHTDHSPQTAADADTHVAPSPKSGHTAVAPEEHGGTEPAAKTKESETAPEEAVAAIAAPESNQLEKSTPSQKTTPQEDHIDQAPSHETPSPPQHENLPTGVAFVDAAIASIDYELNSRFWGWRPNDIVNFTDNVNHFQLGVLEVTRRTVVMLAERISRTGSTDAFNPHLENAMNWLMVKADRYWFPAPESKYKESIDELSAYKQELLGERGSFFTRTDNLIPLLSSYEDLLGSCDENLVKQKNEDGSDVSHFKADDYFFYAKGVASTMATLLEAIHHDFYQTLENRHATELLHHALESCKQAAALAPLLITNGELDGILANHRANMAAPISHARFYIGQLIKTLST